ncbi:MAG: tRNA (adenosine(37)-N6)-threonylcarbamoyltransferase complex dimerization subunit type 1 TsaB [Rhodoferax sp.]|nr:tRNA (adenosine(37)-N6)-threonylcarbamoyltransferase complex dimerization subunit type 1 TsaB [Rhodoferax sp.]
MKLLAFDTSTEILSVAVSRDDAGAVQLWQYSGAGGARASTDLIPTVLNLMQQAGLQMNELDAICFGCGPGSFTGLRTACAVAQGLAFGAGVPVLPVDSLLAVAEEARFMAMADVAQTQVVALLDARMDEMYTASFAWGDGRWTTLTGDVLVRPEDFAEQSGSAVTLAGNVFAVYEQRLMGVTQRLQCVTALPTATAMLRLATQLLAAGKSVPADQALPSYIRDKVAKTTAERMAEKAAATP